MQLKKINLPFVSELALFHSFNSVEIMVGRSCHSLLFALCMFASIQRAFSTQRRQCWFFTCRVKKRLHQLRTLNMHERSQSMSARVVLAAALPIIIRKCTGQLGKQIRKTMTNKPRTTNNNMHSPFSLSYFGFFAPWQPSNWDCAQLHRVQQQ